MVSSFDGQVAIITGGANGIGFGIADFFIKKGCSVVLVDMNEKSLMAAQSKLQKFGKEYSLYKAKTRRWI